MGWILPFNIFQRACEKSDRRGRSEKFRGILGDLGGLCG